MQNTLTDTMAGNGSSHHNNEAHNETQVYPTSLYITLHVVGIPLAVCIVVGNIILMAVLKITKHKEEKAFKTKTSLVLGNLAFCDFLGGLVLLINIGLYSLYDDIGKYSPIGCYFWNLVGMLPLVGSFFFLMLLGVERYVIVNRIPNYPRMNKLLLFICLLWIYDVIVCVFATVFMNNVHPDAYIMCDIMTLPHMYIGVFVFIHIFVCMVTCSVLIIVIRNTVKHHQCKIQVSNTITYNNLLSDTHIAKLFYVVSLVTFTCWLPFLICEMVLASGLQSTTMLTVTRWTFLFGHLGYLKFYWILLFNSPLQRDIKSVFSKKKERPFRMGTIVRAG